jgi:uncharacterized membrane protein YidH (DUF202 family)
MFVRIFTRRHWLMTDLALGIFGLCLVAFSPIILALFPTLYPRIVGRAFVLGLIIIGGVLSTILYPE